MINNRLNKWSQDHVLEDLLLKTPNYYPYDLNVSNKGNLDSKVRFNSSSLTSNRAQKVSNKSQICALFSADTKNPLLNSQSIIPKSIIINVCSNKAVMDKRRLISILLALELITGQKGLLTKAKYSLATFRLKKGMEIGVKITLKKSNMWYFLDKLIHIIIPSLVYFSKLKDNRISYDKCGNLAIGIEDINIFPEIDWLRESQHPLTQGIGNSSFITGMDILIETI